MPYLRVHTRALPIEQKCVIARNLIEITLRTLHLHRSQRYRTSVQFITLPSSRGAVVTLEVIAHNLTEDKKKEFAEEASVMLRRMVPIKGWDRITRLFDIKIGLPQQVALQFTELSSAISDPYVEEPQQRAA